MIRSVLAALVLISSFAAADARGMFCSRHPTDCAEQQAQDDQWWAGLSEEQKASVLRKRTVAAEKAAELEAAGWRLFVASVLAGISFTAVGGTTVFLFSRLAKKP